MSETTSYEVDPVLKNAAKHGSLVVFVGAGASVLCGSPNWKGFSDKVVNVLEKQGVLKFLGAEQLRAFNDPRRTLSIAQELASENSITIDYGSILHPSEPEKEGLELYQLLAKLDPVFVTTNYDRWLSTNALDAEIPTVLTGNEQESDLAKRPEQRKRYYKREQLSSDLLSERGSVIHLHGFYEDPKSMVLSLRDYISHYADRNVQEFLGYMFANYTVLFVGYGLAEFEVLDTIIRANPATDPGKDGRTHFLLYPCFSVDAIQTDLVSKFFLGQCGVKVIPYHIDSNGYKELVNVFKVWSSDLEIRDASTLDLHSLLDSYIKDGSQDVSRKAAISFVQKHPELTAYFLNSLKDLSWFESLDAEGFFGFDPSERKE